MPTILVAEDDPEINALMSLTLRLEGYDVLQATDGATALEAARGPKTPDLILLDVMMPRMSGYEVARSLQDDGPDIPIIFVTAKHNTEDLVLGLEMGVDYVCKPFAMPELLARAKAALRMSRLQEELRASNEQLARLAVTDELTGLPNRRGFEGFLEDELWRACRFGQPLAVLMFDLDRFKQINDTWGHPQGDTVLKAFADVLMHSSRRIDRVARFGGEEFAALLPSTDASGAATFGEKVRAMTENLRVPRVDVATCAESNGAPPVRFTVSGGAAVALSCMEEQLPIPALAAGMIAEADRCLYRAKSAGRNGIVVQTVSGLHVSALTN